MTTKPKMYPEYLCTDCWKAKRQAKLQDALFQCEVRKRCKGARASEVHHLTYERIGCELLEDLQAVCAKCHRALHGIPEPQPVKPANDNVPSRQLTLFANEDEEVA